MNEAILIEIAQRFRWLEDGIEAADLYLASFREGAQRRIDRADAAKASGEISYATYCNRVNEPMADIANLDEVRAAIEKHLERCREDMVAMQELIRKAAR